MIIKTTKPYSYRLPASISISYTKQTEFYKAHKMYLHCYIKNLADIDENAMLLKQQFNKT